jgi:hydroxyacylglutathione hydrolase
MPRRPWRLSDKRLEVMSMDSPALQITPIPAFSDNYIWLLQNADCNRVALVDPGDPAPVLKHLRAHRLELSALLITHHHWDHVGAIAELRAVFPKCRVYGPRDRHIPDVTDWVAEGCDVVLSALGEGVSFNVLAVPGHTATHVAYYRAGMLFCGDTLFAGGCGRVFDGTFAQLAASLQRIAHLPADTLVYCAHEYTLANLVLHAGWSWIIAPCGGAKVKTGSVWLVASRACLHCWQRSCRPIRFCALASRA